MRTTSIIGLVLVAAAATACGGSSDASSSAASAASTAAPAATGGAAGTYTRQMTAGDIARTDSFRQEGANQTTPAPGALTLKLAKGTVSVTDDTGFEVAELSKLGDDASLEIQSYVDPTKASFCGPDAPQNASYTWKLDGDTLILSPVEDRCADRNSMLAGSWSRSG
jgi:hypothetical protein